MHPDTAFPAQFEQEQLHRKFIRTFRIIFYIALAGIFGLAFFSDGGNDARTLPFFLFAGFVALSCEMLATAKRLERGALLSAGFLLFLPWFVLQVLEILWLSPFPGNAELALCTSLVPFSLFFIALHCSRSNGGQTRLLAGTLIFLLLGTIAGITYQINLSEDFSGSLAMKIFAGYLSDPAAAGGVAILIFFASIVLVLRRGTDSRNRMFALYTGLLAFCMIVLTRNTAVWLSALAGTVIFASLQVHKKTARAATIILLACGIAVTPIFSEMPFKTPPEIAGVQKSESSKTEALPSRIELQKIALSVFSDAPILGSGTSSFCAEFRQKAPQQWQISPSTSNNLYTFVLAENGIVGFVLLFVPAGFIFLRAVKVCLALPREKHSSSPKNNDEKLHNANTRSLLSGLLGGITAIAILVAQDFSPSFLPVILGVSVFGGIIMHESAPSRFARVCICSGKRRKVAFAAAILLPAGIFALALPATYSAAQCDVGKRAIAPFLQNFYGNANSETEYFEPQKIEAHFLAAISAHPKNAEARIELARLYILSAYVAPESIPALAQAMNDVTRKAIAAAPELAEAYLYNAIARILLGEKDAAREALDRAEKLAPNDLPLLFQIAEAHRMLSPQKTPPKAILEHITQIAPASPRVRQMNSIVDLTSQSQDSKTKKPEEPDASLQSLFEI